MALTIQPICEQSDFVAEVSGIDLTQAVSEPHIERILRSIDEFAVLLFRDQAIDDVHQLAFTHQLGVLEPAVGNNVIAQQDRRLKADFSDVSNLDRDGGIFDREDRGRLFGFGNRLWHTDASFRAVPAKFSILSARTMPEAGGNTEFADMRAAWDALDESTRQTVKELVAEHSLMHSRALLGFGDYSAQEREAFAPVRQTMVRTLATTGRTALYLAAHAGDIVGWPTPEARVFIFDLIEHATQNCFVYVHKWRPHDLIMWDNRQTMHRVRRFNDLGVKRDVRRTTIRGDGPTVAQAQ